MTLPQPILDAIARAARHVRTRALSSLGPRDPFEEPRLSGAVEDYEDDIACEMERAWREMAAERTLDRLGD